MRLKFSIKSPAWLTTSLTMSLMMILLTSIQGCSNHGSFSQLVDDEVITLDITAELNSANNKLLLANNINILTNNAKVLLSGQVRTAAERKQIVEIAAQTASVQQVYNQIRLGKPISFQRASKDAWLTTKVKSSFVNIKDIKPLNVKVITENAEVFLIGRVTKNQGNQLAEAARYVVGVDKVIKVFEYH